MKLKSERGVLNFVFSALAITILLILIFNNIGWVRNLIDVFYLIIFVFILSFILLKFDWLKDAVEVSLVLLFVIILSQFLLGQKMLIPLVAVTSCSMLHGDDGIGMSSAKFSQSVGYKCYASDEYKIWRHVFSNANFSEEEIKKFPMQNGFSIGDMILVITPNGRGEIFGFEFPTLFSETKIGDVVIYERDLAHGGGEPIIHRVVGIIRIKNWTVDSVDGTLSNCITADEINTKFIPMVVDCINKKPNCPYRSYPTKGNFNFYITKGDNNPGIDQCGSIAYPVNEEQLVARGWIRLPYIGWLKLLLNEILNFFIPH